MLYKDVQYKYCYVFINRYKLNQVIRHYTHVHVYILDIYTALCFHPDWIILSLLLSKLIASYLRQCRFS